jgi:hypothetical protein
MKEKIKSFFFRIVCGNCGIIVDFNCTPSCSDHQTEEKRNIGYHDLVYEKVL